MSGVLAGLLALLAPATLSAQAERARRPEHPGETLHEAPAVSMSRAESECLEFPSEDTAVGLSDRLLAETCRVVASGELAATGPSVWRWALYRRLRVYGPDSDTRPEDLPLFPDSVQEEELVLFTAAAGAESLRPVWHDRSDSRFELIREPSTVPLGSEAALLRHRRCLNGTGGCVDYPHQLSDMGAITPLRMRYAEQITDALPKGWGTWKGIWLHRDRLSAWAGVYVPGDVNCCPSFLATAPLRVAIDELTADSVIIAPDTGSSAWKVSPGEGFGFISRRTSEVDLVDRYGASPVKQADVYLAEGFCTPGTLVFPGTVLQVEVGWADSAKTRPAFVRAREDGAPWRTWKGVRVGLPLDSLEAIAGEPVSFAGFGWDYGGGMTWELDGGSLNLRLAPVPFNQLQAPPASDPGFDELLGDRVVRSDHPLVRRLHIEVREMSVHWARPAIERDCE